MIKIGQFIQGLVNIFKVLGDAITGIIKEIKDEKKTFKQSVSNAFSKEGAAKWLYFIPVVLVFLLGVSVVVFF